MAKPIICAALSLLVTGAAFAADPPVPAPTPVDAKYRTLGVGTGMTPDQVKAAFKISDPDCKITEQVATYQATGEKFIRSLACLTTKADKDDPSKLEMSDRTNVAFSQPSTGNKSILVSRIASYQGASRPVMDAMNNLLVEKYGESPQTFAKYKTHTGNASGKFLIDENGHLRKEHQYYSSTNCGDDANALSSFNQQCGGATFAWRVDSSLDPDLATQMFITAKDHTFAVASMAYDQRQIDEAAQKQQAAAVQAHDKNIEALSKTAPTPKL